VDNVFKTPQRMEWPTVLLVALDRDLALTITESLGEQGFTVIFSGSAAAARERIPQIMPHAIIVRDSLAESDRLSLVDVADAVGAELIAVPPNAHPAILRERVMEATDRTSEMRLKVT
jgi:DNA-binding NtrC family response regulator